MFDNETGGKFYTWEWYVLEIENRFAFRTFEVHVFFHVRIIARFIAFDSELFHQTFFTKQVKHVYTVVLIVTAWFATDHYRYYRLSGE